MNVYCTIFDQNYVARALALYRSLVKNNENAIFAFVCIDEPSANILEPMRLERALVVRHDQFADEVLRATQNSRSRGEYCWSSKPVGMLYLMAAHPAAEWVIYVDSDMMFFADPDWALLDQSCHYLLTRHRFSPVYKQFEQTAGLHNAGYVAARNTSNGKVAIAWWRDRCIESCSAISTVDTYADQKYLDRFALLFPWGKSSNLKGLNAAPWNIDEYRVCKNGDWVMVDEEVLLLYHFQGLQIYDDNTASLYIGNRRIPDPLRKIIYRQYMDALELAYADLRKVEPTYRGGLFQRPSVARHVSTRLMSWMRRRKNLVRFPVK